MTEFMYMILMAVMIGIVAGFGSVGVKYLIEFISDWVFSGEGTILERVMATPWYMLLIIPTVGGIIVGPFAHFVVPASKGHGVTEVIHSLLTKGGIIKPVVAIGKSITSAVTIGTGGSVGYEGPIVHIGASIGSSVGQFFRVPTRRLRTLVGCGAAAGIAATFNMPIAGALFAIEVIMMDYAAFQLFPIIISSVIATVISHHYIGNFAEFNASPIVLSSSFEIFNYFILGALCGLIAFLMIKSLYYFEGFFTEQVKVPEYMKPAIGGLMIGAIGIFYPQIIGVGNDSISLALDNNFFWLTAMILVFIKIVSTSITLGSGGSGGMLSPALFVGAMTGFAFGEAMNFIDPSTSFDSGSYAFIAMGGLIAGTVRAPLTAILMVFELTRQSSAILPLMIVVSISMILSSKLSRESVYTLKLIMNKIQIKSFGENSILKSIPVSEIICKNYIALPENAKFSEIANKLLSGADSCISVHTMKGKYLGIISINILKDTLLDRDHLSDVVIAGDIADKAIPKVTLDTSCYEVMELCRARNIDGLPVVDSVDTSKQVGIIWLKDVNDILQIEMDKMEHTTDLASKISRINKEHDIAFMPGYVIAEIQVPEHFVGRTIAGLKVRSNFGIDIISIKSQTDKGIVIKALPKPDYILKDKDAMIVAGEAEKVNILKGIS
ncbi:MAG: chloride channel protein [Candidatus Kapabacteria bacterium]|nr:chloride channel protein [Ignavibacteriota bacterium]MCW5884271.1 chloride channel protein [Candidatus Kapabacteria bacterium]